MKSFWCPRIGCENETALEVGGLIGGEPRVIQPEIFMQRSNSHLFALCATALLAVSVSGCAQRGRVQTGLAPNVDCRTCHTSTGAAGAKDFSHIYTTPSSHHPVGVKYPANSNAKPNYSLPNGQVAGVTFFDRNGNGLPDNNEIQLFRENGAATIECASCHVEHGKTPALAKSTGNSYLRVDNDGSALCTTCHNY